MRESYVDFGRDIDPISFVLEQRVGFLHIIRNYASLLRSVNKEKKTAASHYFAHHVNNYRLVLNSFQFKIHGEAEGLLSVLLAHMDTVWEERQKLSVSDMAYIADEIAMAYINLTDYLDSKNSKPVL